MRGRLLLSIKSNVFAVLKCLLRSELFCFQLKPEMHSEQSRKMSFLIHSNSALC